MKKLKFIAYSLLAISLMYLGYTMVDVVHTIHNLNTHQSVPVQTSTIAPANPTKADFDMPGDNDDFKQFGKMADGTLLGIDTTSIKKDADNNATFFMIILIPSNPKVPEVITLVEKVQINCNKHQVNLVESTALDETDKILDHKVFPEKWVDVHVGDQGKDKPGVSAVLDSIVCPRGHFNEPTYTAESV